MKWRDVPVGAVAIWHGAEYQRCGSKFEHGDRVVVKKRGSVFKTAAPDDDDVTPVVELTLEQVAAAHSALHPRFDVNKAFDDLISKAGEVVRSQFIGDEEDIVPHQAVIDACKTAEQAIRAAERERVATALEKALYHSSWDDAATFIRELGDHEC